MESNTNGTPNNTTTMIPIGTHRLSMTLSGPPNPTPNAPLVIIIAGAGDVASSYVALKRLLITFTQVLTYDRSGLGRSDPRPPTTTQEVPSIIAAKELHALLSAVSVTQPLLLVAHSYGAIIAREYLHLHPDRVAGLVLQEASTERQPEYFDLPDQNINAVLGDMNFAQVTGLRDAAQLDRDEWRVRARDIARGWETGATQTEMDGYRVVCETLRAKEQYAKRVMGAGKPLSVIRGNTAREFERIYESGVARGYGTEEQRRAFRRLLDGWEAFDRQMKEEQLLLTSGSGSSRLVHLSDCGHHVHLERPDVVAQEVRWVWEGIVRGR